jgi:hypothetical protein
MIYAEKRCERYSDGSGYTDRYLVWNGDLIGSYGVHYSGRGAYGASRDYHALATPAQIEANRKWQAFANAPEDEQELIANSGNEPDYAQYAAPCGYHDGLPSLCDGSSLVEVITDNEQRCFEIAAMMANVDKETM